MKAWEFLVEENHWENIPHFALGGSSGGAFILYLAQRVQFNGLIPVIMSVPSAFLETKTKEPGTIKQTNIPPTFYISTERDQIFLEGGGVASNVATLAKQVDNSFLLYLIRLFSSSPVILFSTWAFQSWNYKICKARANFVRRFANSDMKWRLYSTVISDFDLMIWYLSLFSPHVHFIKSVRKLFLGFMHNLEAK